MFEALHSLLSSLAQIIFDSLSWFFTSFYGFMIEKVSVLLSAVLQGLNLPYGVSWLPEFYQYANFFFPLNELLAIATVLFGFWLTIFVLKIVLKAIPTLW